MLCVHTGITGVKPSLPPKPKPVEDIPGVPTAAWVRVNRGVPASDPFQPGEGFMLMVDAARFLPGKCVVRLTHKCGTFVVRYLYGK